MKRCPFTIIPALLLMCVTQLQAQHSKPQHNSQAHFYMTEGVEVEKSSETGWVDLFNGKDLTNWKTTGNWIVKDGVVTLHPREGEHGWQRYDAYLTSEKVYSDFVLEVDFKYEKGGNTGLFLRVGDLKDHVASGFELQMFDTGHKEKPGNHDTGGIIGATAPFSQQAKPGGQWQRYQVILNGSYIVVFLNGELVQACDLSKSPLWNRSMAGYISLQDEAKEVSFKSIRIKELK